MAGNNAPAAGPFPQPYDSAGTPSLQQPRPQQQQQAESSQPELSDGGGSSMAPPPPPPPELWQQLQALLDVLLGRLREHWEVDDDGQLAVQLQATARSLQARGM